MSSSAETAKFRFWGSLLILFVTAGLAMIALGLLPAHSDITWFQSWTEAGQQFGYAELRQTSSFNYLPGFVAVVWLSNVGQTALQSIGAAPEFSRYWRGFIFAVESGLVLWLSLLLRPYYKQSIWLGWLLLFNPVLVWVMWVWGQVDAIVIIPFIISLVYLVQRRFWAFGLVALGAVLLKPTGILMLPLLGLLAAIELIRTSRYKSWLRDGVLILALIAGLTLPLLPIVSQWLAGHATNATATPLTWNSYNGWFVLSDLGYAQTIWLGLPWRVWSGVVTMVVVVALTYWLFAAGQAKLDFKQRLILYVSFTVVYTYSFNLLLTDMHERYWDFALIPLICLGFMARSWRPLLIILTLTFLINMILIFPSSIGLFNSWASRWHDWGVIISWLHIIMVLPLVWLWVRTSKDMLMQAKENCV